MRWIFIIFCGLLIFVGCRHDVYLPGDQSINDTTTGGTGGGGNNGGSASDLVCFETEILPLFTTNCAKSGCHNSASHKGGYVFEDYDGIMKGVEPGKPGKSEVYEAITEDDADKRMPPPPNEPLLPSQVQLIKLWIEEGAQNTTNCATDCDTTIVRYSVEIKTILDRSCRGCHGTTNPSSGINLYDYPTISTLALDGLHTYGTLLSAVMHEGGASPMPKGGNQLPACDINMFRAWVNRGAPNN